MTSLTEKNIKYYKSRYDIETFVETGCWNGDSLAAAYNVGLDCYSCDINPDYVRNCRMRFPSAKLFDGDSQVVLADMIEGLTKPTLFWLDAHLPKYHDAEEPLITSKFPLYQELLIIRHGKVNYERDVILCDDVRTIKSHPLYASGVPDDIAVDFINYDELLAILRPTHNVNEMAREYGVLEFTPK